MSVNTTTMRRAVGAGRWFDSNPSSLKKEVNEYIQTARKNLPEVPEQILGCICPHAGFRFSGPTAGLSIAALMRDAEVHGTPDVVVIIGFSHSAHFTHAAVMDGAGITTPIGTSTFDNDAINMICSRHSCKCDYSKHNGEHSAENEIPFVQTAFPDVKIVVILVGTHDQTVMNDVALGLQDISKQKKMYVVASSDMLHDADHQLVVETDRKTLRATEQMKIEELLKMWSYDNQIYCGITAVVPTMLYCRAVGGKKAYTLADTNSELVTGHLGSGWVVGYSAVVFVK